MSTHSDQLATALPMSMRVIARNMAVAMDQAELEINFPQFGMLDFLLTNSEAVQTDLANHMYKDKSVILRQLDQLEQSGWVERQMDANDRRRKNLVVTKSGQEIYKKAAKLRDKVFAQVLEGIAPKDLETVLKVLERMRENAMAKDK